MDNGSDYAAKAQAKHAEHLRHLRMKTVRGGLMDWCACSLHYGIGAVVPVCLAETTRSKRCRKGSQTVSQHLHPIVVTPH